MRAAEVAPRCRGPAVAAAAAVPAERRKRGPALLSDQMSLRWRGRMSSGWRNGASTRRRPQAARRRQRLGRRRCSAARRLRRRGLPRRHRRRARRWCVRRRRSCLTRSLARRRRARRPHRCHRPHRPRGGAGSPSKNAVPHRRGQCGTMPGPSRRARPRAASCGGALPRAPTPPPPPLGARAQAPARERCLRWRCRPLRMQGLCPCRRLTSRPPTARSAARRTRSSRRWT